MMRVHRKFGLCNSHLRGIVEILRRKREPRRALCSKLMAKREQQKHIGKGSRSIFKAL